MPTLKPLFSWVGQVGLNKCHLKPIFSWVGQVGLGLAGEFVGFIIIFTCFPTQQNLVNRKHPTRICPHNGTPVFGDKLRGIRVHLSPQQHPFWGGRNTLRIRVHLSPQRACGSTRAINPNPDPCPGTYQVFNTWYFEVPGTPEGALFGEIATKCMPVSYTHLTLPTKA